MAENDELLAAWADSIGDEEVAWATARPGPPLSAVASRLSALPQVYLDERVSLEALAGDVLGVVPHCAAFADDERVRRAAAVGLWLCASEELVEPFAPSLVQSDRARGVDALGLRVAVIVDVRQMLTVAERRDEAVRFFLFGLGLLPAGEDARTARSLLGAADSLARDAALAAAYSEHRHRAQLRRKLEEARAREAAARYSHE